MNCALITGASRGIGRATARLFRDADWRAVSLSRSHVAEEGIEHLALDLASHSWEEEMGEVIRSAADGADRVALVHNAASYESDRADALPAAQLRRVMEVNLVGPARLNQLLLPAMGEGSAIIYVGSTLSEKAVPGAASYSISKHALLGLMRATCQDLGSRGIHTCAICPGFTDTEMLRSHIGAVPGLETEFKARVPSDRLIQPEEIAQLIFDAAQRPVLNGSVIHAHLGQIER
ncbi:MAG: SDR family oxidoreductase [Planctomycetota bacterium]|jgi:NAD(P)-dependent dehydrogenase (short-subunit alcohol dehydrogenase family)|nr:SDR family oxidoreductase [Planctomycetota bacterium]